MRFMRKFFRITAVCCLAISIVIMTTIAGLNSKLPKEFNVIRDDKTTMPDMQQLTGTNLISYDEASAVNAGIMPKQLSLKLFNMFPVNTTEINIIENEKIVPGGTPFGIKLFTKGVMVIGINNVETISGMTNPAKLAGIVKGDVIVSMNSIELSSNEQVAKIIEDSNGENIILTLERNDKMIKTILTPAISELDGKAKGGIWVRDSSAGIGTVTFYEEDTLNFGGLGHGICDVDTGKIMPLNSGQVCAVKINGILKGKAGTPGELRGGFSSNDPCGSLYTNNETGIFGELDESPNEFEPVELMLKQNVKKGAAKIICTLDENGPKEYDIEIEKIDLNPSIVTKNMIVKVTDEELLAKTGGIIQGMSGSPIIQNGKIVGAVTHVFVNNPQKGYGIFVENMLESME